MSKYRIQAGRYRQVISIQQRQFGQNSYGETIQDWTNVFINVRAGVAPIAGREFFDKEAVNPEITHRVHMRYVSGVKPDMRIIYGTRTLIITSVIDYQERHLELQLMCKELIDNE